MQVVAIEHTPHERLGTFEGVLRALGCEPREIIAPEAKATDWKAIATAQVLFVMGGPMGVYEADRYSFLAKELEILKKRIARNAPTLGICLGAQLLAEAAGSKVLRSGRQEIGWYPVTPTAAGTVDALFKDCDWDSPVFHWHGDTFETPPGAVHLLESERFVQQAFTLTPRLYGIQFHPEVTADEIHHWIDSEPNVVYGTDGIQSQKEIIELGLRYAQNLAGLSSTLVRRFLAQVSS